MSQLQPAQSESKPHVKLSERFATALCGNDILSSALYVSGIAVVFSGIYAPLVLIVVAMVLFLYKAVYTEVVEALPVNGGAYNCLLNGTSKTIAAIAGLMTLLSYIATAVISAKVAVEYLGTIVHVQVIPATIVLLLVFAVLVVSGIKDSAKVAFSIFSFHIVSLTLFLIFALIYFIAGNSSFELNSLVTHDIIASKGGLFQALFLGFSASLLGVSGFESSANFVEEQQPGVFRKTLRNMLIGVAIFNPLIALAVLNTLPYEAVVSAKDFLLAEAAFAVGGTWFKYFIVVDAFLVLSGAVLTSYVGVSGLIHRMAADGCLPNFLTATNKKGSFPRIVFLFFALCSSILVVTRGELLSLAGVYTISFLGVMSLFAFGNLILRETRTELKRTYRAPIMFVFLALSATLLGILGNIKINPSNFLFFSLYFFPSLAIVFSVLYEDMIVRWILRLSEPFLEIHKKLNERLEHLADTRLVAFVHHVSRLHPIIEYINKNEHSNNIILIHCGVEEREEDCRDFQEIKQAIPLLQKAGVYPHFSIKVLYRQGVFGPEVIERVSRELKIRRNRILIGSIHHHHPYDYADLGGVRIII